MKSHFASTHKKVVVRKLDRTLVKGYVEPLSYLQNGCAEVLGLDGYLIKINLAEIKGIYFVREFEGNPSRPERKIFHSRPRLGGLWIRMVFQDKEVMEGLVSRNLLDLDGQGFLVTPPDVYSNNLRIFVPRTALREVEIVGVIGEGAARRGRARSTSAAPGEDQYGLFAGAEPAKK